jgi:hypothetical protein
MSVVRAPVRMGTRMSVRRVGMVVVVVTVTGVRMRARAIMVALCPDDETVSILEIVIISIVYQRTLVQDWGMTYKPGNCLWEQFA